MIARATAVAFAPPRDPTEIAVADWPIPGGTRQRIQTDANAMLAPAEFKPRKHVQPSETANPLAAPATRPAATQSVAWLAELGQAPGAGRQVLGNGADALPALEDLNKLELLEHLPAAAPGISQSAPRKRLSAFFRPARLLPETERFVIAQKWEGVVAHVTQETLIARLTDLTQDSVPEEVELPLEELSQDDRPLVEPGAVFYWSIGYLVSPGGQRTRSSSIRFRRLPAWAPGEVDAARERARKLKDELGW